jgi:cyclic pyranopterin phosphate synthase
MSPDLTHGLTHLDATGAARMVEVSGKPVSIRRAVATGAVVMQPGTLAAIGESRLAKGDVLAVARLAGIMAAKRTDELIPLCHPLPLDGVSVELAAQEPDRLIITATVTTTARTGVEMEALTAVSVAALTVYDMCKAIDRSMTIVDVCLREKTGGRSGDYRRTE